MDYSKPGIGEAPNEPEGDQEYLKQESSSVTKFSELPSTQDGYPNESLKDDD